MSLPRNNFSGHTPRSGVRHSALLPYPGLDQPLHQLPPFAMGLHKLIQLLSELTIARMRTIRFLQVFDHGARLVISLSGTPLGMKVGLIPRF